jgi:hypothetical protein
MNPYLKGKTFVKRNRKVGSEVSAIAKKPGSDERFVGANGEFNASSMRELVATITTLQSEISKGNVLNPTTEKRHQRVQKIMAERKDLIKAATSGRDPQAWQALGAVLGDEILTAGEREGFATNLLLQKNLGAGEIARFKVREKQVTGWQAISPTRIAPSVIRQGYVYPEEFYINANIQVEEKEILQNPGDILEEKLAEGIEQTMVIEDRIFKGALDRSANTANDLVYYNSFTPTVMQSMKTQVSEWGLNVGSMVLAFDVWNDIIADNEFVAFFDQISKHEIVVNGSLASILGVNLITDGFREPHLKVLNRGEVYILAQPNELGGMTSRGDLITEPTRGYNMGQPWRGWFQTRLRSLVIGNSRGVVRAQRS